MARVQVTGPVLHFINFVGDPSHIWFLGTSKVTPRIRVDHAYAPVHMEQGGKMLPFDLVYQGKQAKIITQINYFDSTVAYLLGCSPRYGYSKFALGRGLVSWKDIGSLSLGNKAYFTLYLAFPFANTVNNPTVSTQTPVNNVPFDMPVVYRFGACQIEYEDVIGGTGAQELSLAINVQPIYYSRSKYKSVFQDSALAGGMYVYDHIAFPASLITETIKNIAVKP